MEKIKKSNLKVFESCRIKYDHYQSKVEKLRRKKHDFVSKNVAENSKEIEKFNRVNKKEIKNLYFYIL